MERRLAAILAADVVGYARLMEQDEAGTLAALKSRRSEILQPTISKHHGRIIKVMGDGVLVEFASAVDAVECAIQLQQAMETTNAGVPQDKRIVLRVGINLGDVMVEGSDLYGDGVNIAARLESLAAPGSVFVSQTVFSHVKGKTKLKFEDMGERNLKNMAEPVRVYRVSDAIVSTANIETAKSSEPSRPSIAVLPFTNLSADPEQQYLSDGITEDIITELSRYRGLSVIARNSSFQYRDKSMDMKRVGHELGVEYLVEGSLRKAGNRLRITAQLIEVSTGSHLWAERYDRGMEDVFEIQDEVVRAIAAAVPGQVERSRYDQARKKRPENLTAYDYMLRGRWLLWHTTADQREVIQLFEKALEIDANCAQAHIGLAQTYGYGIYTLGLTPEEALAKARHHLECALAIDDNDAVTLASAAFTYLLCGEQDLARIHSERAFSMNPNDILVIDSHGAVLNYLGNSSAALELLLMSRQLRAHAPDEFRLECLFDCYYMLGDYAKAVETFLRMRSPVNHMLAAYAAVLAQLGRIDEAREALATCLQNAPPSWNPVSFALSQARMCKNPADATHWLDGYRKAGIAV